MNQITKIMKERLYIYKIKKLHALYVNNLTRLGLMNKILERYKL